jgi:hypothetical protein
MFNEVRHSIALARLQRLKRSEQADYDKQVKKTKAAGASADDIGALNFEAFDLATMRDDQILHLNCWFLIQQAQVLLVPYPDYQQERDAWEESRFTGKVRLVAAAQAKLRSAIRQERRERWEGWSRWVPVISALTALAGVTVAILALLKH